MTTSGTGKGEAFSPGVETTASDAPKPSPEERYALIRDKLIAEADVRVAAAEAKVEQQQAHLTGAEEALAQAIAERKAL